MNQDMRNYIVSHDCHEILFSCLVTFFALGMTNIPTTRLVARLLGLGLGKL